LVERDGNIVELEGAISGQGCQLDFGQAIVIGIAKGRSEVAASKGDFVVFFASFLNIDEGRGLVKFLVAEVDIFGNLSGDKGDGMD
jgi:hypothetical protein